MLDYKKQHLAIKKFDDLIRQYIYYVKQAKKIQSILAGRALPFIKENQLLQDDKIQSSIKRLKKFDKLLKELHNELIKELISEGGIIEDIIPSA